MYLMSHGERFSQAIANLQIDGSPNFGSEGFNGYIEVTFLGDIKDLALFTKIWNDWYQLSDEERTKWYRLAKGSK